MENKPKTEIIKFDVDWDFIKEGCMATIGKAAGKTPSKEWKRKLLICQHSPIRRGNISWRWSDIPFCIMGHVVRHHVGCTPYVSTSRADRTEIKDRSQRSQMDSVSMEMDANIDGLISIAGRRLCTQADKTTREYMEDLVDAISEYDEDIAWALVPQCVARGGCCEPFGKCTYYDNFSKTLTKEEQTNITKRYDKYNEYRQKVKSRKNN